MGAGAAAGCKRFFKRNKYEAEEVFSDDDSSEHSRGSKDVVRVLEPVRVPKLPEHLSRCIYGTDDPFKNYTKTYFGDDLSDDDDDDPIEDENGEGDDEDENGEAKLFLEEDDDKSDKKGEDQEAEEKEPSIEEDPRQRLLDMCDAYGLWLQLPESKQLVTRDLQKLYKRRKDIGVETQKSHEAVRANIIGGPWCRVVDEDRKARRNPKFRFAESKVAESAGWCWHRGFVHTACLEFSTGKKLSSPPVLSFKIACAMAAKGGALRAKLNKYSFVIDTEGQQWFWSDDFLQFLKALRFQRNSGTQRGATPHMLEQPMAGQEVIQEEELMILAAEHGVDPNGLFPPVEEPDPNANAVVDRVHVPADLLQRRGGQRRFRRKTVRTPPVPTFPKPDLKIMCQSTLPLTMEYVRRPPRNDVEEIKEEEESEEEEDVSAIRTTMEEEVDVDFDFLASAPLEAPKPLCREDIRDITYGDAIPFR